MFAQLTRSENLSGAIVSGSLDLGTRCEVAKPFAGSGPLRNPHPNPDGYQQDLNRSPISKSSNIRISVALEPPFFAISGTQSKVVVCNPNNLRTHPALLEFGDPEAIDDQIGAERLKSYMAKPVFIDKSGTILAGFRRWRSALLSGERELQCMELALDEEQSLEFILAHHSPQRGWNPFTRICVALKLETRFRRRALANMRDGGRHRGLAELPTLQHVDVRREIAHIARVGPRNVGKVKLILEEAHQRLIVALRDGSLTINKACKLCKLPKSAQLQAFSKSLEDREVDAVIRQALGRKSLPNAIPNAALLLTALQEQESCHPGSVVISRTRSGNLALSVSREVLEGINLQ